MKKLKRGAGCQVLLSIVPFQVKMDSWNSDWFAGGKTGGRSILRTEIWEQKAAAD